MRSRDLGSEDTGDRFIRMTAGTESMERVLAGISAIRRLIDQTSG